LVAHDSVDLSTGWIRVETRSGPVLGRCGDTVQTFLGLPFAAPPVGPLRFKPPAPVQPWTSPRRADNFAPACPHLHYFDPTERGADVMDEDCLALNVWTPAADRSRRPVMVWIHGGGNVGGSARNSQYDGARLARRGDVVVVTIQYRLGVLGFLDFSDIGGEDFAGGGNAALLDVILALEWVRDNVLAFGGDPGNVTVFGESAGADHVQRLMVAPRAQGLFHRALIQSGILTDLHPRERSAHNAALLLQTSGMSLRELQDLPWPALLALAERTGFVFPWCKPNLDGVVLHEQPRHGLAQGRYAAVPLLIGTTLEETRYFSAVCADPDDPGMTPETFSDGILGDPGSLVPFFGDDAQRVIDLYLKAYPSRHEAAVALSTDGLIRVMSTRFAAACSERQPTWMYLFGFRSPVEGRTGQDYGAYHSIEIPFVFGNDGPEAQAVTAPRAQWGALSEQMMDAWTAFARSGDPNTPSLPHWPRYDTARRATMVLDLPCAVVDDPRGDERAAWDGVPLETRRYWPSCLR
jgi:para-nitrobenzyl esterase